VSELDLTARQAAAILALVEEPGATLSRLAEHLGADQATASALVDRLLAAELVRRETDPADRRRAMLHPTEKALKLAKAIAEARRTVEESIRDVLGAGDSAQLAGLLARLADGLERRREAAVSGARTS
jgi:DNA-binding MarR family transcriptional regulator